MIDVISQTSDSQKPLGKSHVEELKSDMLKLGVKSTWKILKMAKIAGGIRKM